MLWAASEVTSDSRWAMVRSLMSGYALRTARPYCGTCTNVLSDERLDYNVRKWDAIRTASLLALGILAATGGLLSRPSLPNAAYRVTAAVLVLAAGPSGGGFVRA
jgi:hypothetical protein